MGLYSIFVIETVHYLSLIHS
ncbi:ErmCL family antibiotic resistance leader peptide [Enterococcus cecorum]